MTDKDDALEAELTALKPHEISPQLRQRIGNELNARPSRRLWIIGALGAAAAAACVLVAFSPLFRVYEGLSYGEKDGHAYVDQYRKLPPMATAPRDEAAPSAVTSPEPDQDINYATNGPVVRVGPDDVFTGELLRQRPPPAPTASAATGMQDSKKHVLTIIEGDNPVKRVDYVLNKKTGQVFSSTEIARVELRPGVPAPAPGAGFAPAPQPPQVAPPPPPEPNKASVEEYNRRDDHPFLLCQREPLSTFSINVDTASYTNVRRMLTVDNHMPPKDAVRVEEFVNYFTYNLPGPDGEHPMAISAEVAACPWRAEHQLVRVGLQAKRLTNDQSPPRNLVFLLDTSGSMDAPNRLPLLKQSLLLLARQLRAQDRVAIVAYAGSAGMVLAPTPGDRFETIRDALDRLDAGGSTNGGDGIQLAYQTAKESFIEGGLNRVILGTDGDFNVGVTGSELVRLVEKQRDSGIYLTILGFGMGNLKDATMEKLSKHGNGQYAYIDTLDEARRLFVEQIAGLVTVAKDVKVQIEFNPGQVQAYRLLGYESRMLAHQDFNDDKKDAGEMGAGHSVIALYEIVPPGVKIDVPATDGLKYQKPLQPTPAAGADEIMTVKVRYIPPAEQKSKLLTVPVAAGKRPFAQASTDFRFAASVAAFAMLLRDVSHKGTATYNDVLTWASGAVHPDAYGHRQEFLTLVRAAQRLAPQ